MRWEGFELLPEDCVCESNLMRMLAERLRSLEQAG